MSSHRLLHLCFFTLALAMHSLGAESAADLIRDEAFIPFYAKLEQAFETEIGSLEPGEQVVVLRPISEGCVRVNASRKGTFTLPLEVTNLASEIERMKHSDDPNLKLVPRMSFFLANRVVSGESGWQDPVRDDLVFTAKRWVLLYGDAQLETTQTALKAIDKYYEGLPESEKRNALFVYMDVMGDKLAIQKIADMLKPSIQCMPGYLSRGYAQSLDHLQKGHAMPQLVELASSGRILKQACGLEAITAWLNEP